MSIRRKQTRAPTISIARLRLHTTAALTDQQAHQLAALIGGAVARQRDLPSLTLPHLSVGLPPQDGSLARTADAVALAIADSLRTGAAR